MTPATELPPDAWVSLATVAERLDVSERQVRRWVAAGRLEVANLGRRCVRVRWGSVLAMLASAAPAPRA